MKFAEPLAAGVFAFADTYTNMRKPVRFPTFWIFVGRWSIWFGHLGEWLGGGKCNWVHPPMLTEPYFRLCYQRMKPREQLIYAGFNGLMTFLTSMIPQVMDSLPEPVGELRDTSEGLKKEIEKAVFEESRKPKRPRSATHARRRPR